MKTLEKEQKRVKGCFPRKEKKIKNK